jgi:hypothetical protein
MQKNFDFASVDAFLGVKYQSVMLLFVTAFSLRRPIAGYAPLLPQAAMRFSTIGPSCDVRVKCTYSITSVYCCFKIVKSRLKL